MQTITFQGPYSLVPNPANLPYLLANADAWASGIYLWAFLFNKAYRVNFIGVCSHSVAERHNEHVADFLGGRRTVYRQTALVDGELVPAYAPRDASEAFVAAIPDLMHMLANLHVFHAPFGGAGANLDRIGTALVAHFQALGGRARAWLDNEPVSYDPAAWPDRLTVRLGRPAFIASLPDEMHL